MLQVCVGEVLDNQLLRSFLKSRKLFSLENSMYISLVSVYVRSGETEFRGKIENFFLDFLTGHKVGIYFFVIYIMVYQADEINPCQETMQR